MPVPALFMFIPSMSAIANQNIHQGLRLVSSASYTEVDIPPDRPDRAHTGHPIDAILHFDPPVGIWLGTELLTLMSIQVDCRRKGL